MGNGDAILAAEKLLNDEPFIVAFSDALMRHKENEQPLMMTLVRLFAEFQAPLLVLETVPKKHLSRYGVVKVKKIKAQRNLYQILDIIEKPSPKEAPSNLAVVGRYILTPQIIACIKKLYPPKAGTEVLLAEALRLYLRDGGKLYGLQFKGHRFDCGSKLGLLQAQAYFGLHHKELGKEFRKYLKKLK